MVHDRPPLRSSRRAVSWTGGPSCGRRSGQFDPRRRLRDLRRFHYAPLERCAVRLGRARTAARGVVRVRGVWKPRLKGSAQRTDRGRGTREPLLAQRSRSDRSSRRSAAPARSRGHRGDTRSRIRERTRHARAERGRADPLPQPWRRSRLGARPVPWHPVGSHARRPSRTSRAALSRPSAYWAPRSDRTDHTHREQRTWIVGSFVAHRSARGGGGREACVHVATGCGNWKTKGMRCAR